MYKTRLIPLASIITSVLFSTNAQAHEQSAANEPINTLNEKTLIIAKVEQPPKATTISKAAAKTASDQDIPLMNLAPLPTTKASRAVFIRGFTSLDTQATKNSAITINHDQVYMGRTVGLAADLVDLEDVEYQRGPSSHSGRSALAGSVNYVSVKPQDEFQLKQIFSVGSQNDLKSKTLINIPFTDTLSGRFTISSHSRDGAIKSTNPNAAGDFGDVDTSAATAAFRWKPNDQFTADYLYDYSDADYLGPYIQLLASDSLQPANANPDRQSSTDLYLDKDSNHTAKGHRLGLQWQFNNRTTLESITAFRQAEGSGNNVVGTADSTMGGTIDADQWSQEFRLTSSILNERIAFTLGSLYYTEDSDTSAHATDERFVNNTDYTLGNGFQLSPGQLYQGTQTSNYQTETKGELENIAVYGEISINPAIFDDKLTITAGLRQEWANVDASKQYDGQCQLVPSGGAITDPTSPLYQSALAITAALCPGAWGENTPFAGNDIDNVYIDNSASFDMLLPSLMLSYEVGREKHLYTSVRKGWTPGGFNALAGVENFTAGFKEETMMTYDLGFKGNFANRALQLHTVAYYNDIDNHQANISNRNHPTMIDTYNVAKAHSYGVDVDMFAFLSRNMMVKLNYAYLQMEYDEYTRHDEVKSKIPGSDPIMNPITMATPDAIPQTPEHTAIASLIYRFDETLYGQPTLLLTNIYRDSFYSVNNGIDILENDAFSVLNLDFTLTEIPLSEGFLSLNVWSKNLLDEEYTLAKYGYGYGSGATSGPVIGVFGPERTFGINISYTY